MKNKNEIKERLLNACKENIEQRIASIQKVLNSIEESRNNETKSSVGDKYETGRTMMQIEEEKNKHQLFEAYQVRQVLTKIDPRRVSSKVEIGSLVETNKGNYYLSVGLGKISLENEWYYCLSSKSPIGMKMLNKAIGDEFEFNGATLVIKGIY